MRPLLFIAFLEGAAVMACELFGAKMIAPFYGTTLYSWAAVLSITLIGLAAGYFSGGLLTKRYDLKRLLIVIFLAAGVLLFTMPFISSFIMQSTLALPVQVGLLTSVFVFLFPPMMLFGMVSPVIIKSLVDSLLKTGEIAGRVFAVSTVGGVLSTLMLGFIIIPEFGIKIPTMILGAGVILLPLFLLVPRWYFITTLVLPLLAILTYQETQTEIPVGSRFKVIHRSEGLLGQIKVVDFKLFGQNVKSMHVRGLFVNNTWQTLVNMQNQVSILDYVYYINPLISHFSANSDALLIGLGGGVLAKSIKRKQLNVDVVEIDKRLRNISVDYFGLDPGTNIIIDDGRHYLRKSRKKYDLIIFDAFLGENPPWQLLTLETFKKVRKLLKPNGIFLIEFYGLLEGKQGLAGRSLLRTLRAANFQVDIIGTRKNEAQDRNFIYVASVEKFNYENLDYDPLIYSDIKIRDLREHLVDTRQVNLNDAILLTDDRPVLDKILLGATIRWRRLLNEELLNSFLKEKMPIYY